MGRPWEYPRWRRVLMQILMGCVLAATLGLAALISRKRGLPALSSGVAVELGPVMIRPLAGWDETMNSDVQQGVLQYISPDRTVLTVSVLRLPANSRAADDLAQLTGNDDAKPLDFKGLAKTGVLTTIPVEGAGNDDQSSGRRAFLALAALPSHDVLRIALVPPGKIRADDRSLLVKFAQAVTWSEDQPGQQAPDAPTNDDQ